MNTTLGYYEVHLRDYLYILRKRKKAVFFFLIFVLALTVLITLNEKVLYRSSATVLIERENPNVVDFKEVMAIDASSTDYYQTQYQMIKSRSLIQTLVREEKLEQDVYLSKLKQGSLRWLFLRNILPDWFGEFMAEPQLEDLFIRKMLRINPVRNSRLVEVSVLHPDAERAAQITNSLVSLFIKRNLEDRFLISQQASGLISNQLVDLKVKVGEAEKKLQKYKEENGLVNIPSVREDNQFIKDAKLELVKVQSEESKLAKRYLPAHPKRIHIRSQIEGLQEKIDAEEKRLLQLSRVAVDYTQLEREANSARQIYEALLARLQETSSEARTQASNIIVVDKAQASARPYKPRPLLNLIIALFIGSIGGVFLAFFFEYLDSTVKIPDDIEKGLGLDLLGIIPRADMTEAVSGGGKLFLKPSQHSPAAEAIRALRTALLFKLRHVPNSRTLLITSPNPEEGKSTIALNLSVAFAQNHLKVVLIDADLRKPKLHKSLGVRAEKGLADVLEGDCSLNQAIQSNVAELGFDFLSCGRFSDHPTEILGVQSMDYVLNALKEEYDIIIMDSPPFLAVADVAVLSEKAEAMIVVARYHKTDKRHLRNLKQKFSHPGLKELGVVINQVGVKEKDYYYN